MSGLCPLPPHRPLMDGAGAWQSPGCHGDPRLVRARLRRQRVARGRDDPASTKWRTHPIAHIQHTGEMLPALEYMRLLDPQTFPFYRRGQLPQPSAAVLFYDLLAAMGPKLEGRPQALMAYRSFDVALVGAGSAIFARRILRLCNAARLYSDPGAARRRRAAGRIILRRRDTPGRRAAVLTFLIAGPILFRVLGAPLG